MSSYGSLLQALIALLVASVDLLALSVEVVGAFVPLSIAGALHTCLEVGEGCAVGEAATILCRLDLHRLGVASCTLELVEVLGAELTERASEVTSRLERHGGSGRVAEGNRDVRLVGHPRLRTCPSDHRRPE